MSAMMVKVTFAAWGLGIVLSICIAQWITKPLKNMKKTMVRYGAGDFSARVSVKGKDEIAAFGHLFNQMAEQDIRFGETDKNRGRPEAQGANFRR